MSIKKIIHPKLEFSDITYGFFTRNGGYSKSPFNSLNCSFNVEDNESDVKKNLKLVCNELGLQKLIRLNQIHSSKVFVVNDKDDQTYNKQVCIYSYNNSDLDRFLSYGRKSKTEKIEDIEILRFFELNINIKMFEASKSSLAVDVPEDVKKVENALRENHKDQ